MGTLTCQSSGPITGLQRWHKGALPLPLHRPALAQVSPAFPRINEGPCKPLKVTSSASYEEGKHQAFNLLQEGEKASKALFKESKICVLSSWFLQSPGPSLPFCWTPGKHSEVHLASEPPWDAG